MNLELPRETCARCGAAFGCGAQVGTCWCATVSVTPDDLRALERRFEGCLCPACLESAGEWLGSAPQRAVRSTQSRSAGSATRA